MSVCVCVCVIIVCSSDVLIYVNGMAAMPYPRLRVHKPAPLMQKDEILRQVTGLRLHYC